MTEKDVRGEDENTFCMDGRLFRVSPEVKKVLEKARQLIEYSNVLVDTSKELCAEIAARRGAADLAEKSSESD